VRPDFAGCQVPGRSAPAQGSRFCVRLVTGPDGSSVCLGVRRPANSSDTSKLRADCFDPQQGRLPGAASSFQVAWI
jgi:hypothetical protein